MSDIFVYVDNFYEGLFCLELFDANTKSNCSQIHHFYSYKKHLILLNTFFKLSKLENLWNLYCTILQGKSSIKYKCMQKWFSKSFNIIHGYLKFAPVTSASIPWSFFLLYNILLPRKVEAIRFPGGPGSSSKTVCEVIRCNTHIWNKYPVSDTFGTNVLHPESWLYSSLFLIS